MFVTVLRTLGTLPITGYSAMLEEEPGSSTSKITRLIPLRLQLEHFLHFDAHDGQRVVVSPGMHLVEPIRQGEPRLTFWDEEGSVTLHATRTTHDQRVKTPEAYLIREETNEEIHHVVVWLPDGIAFETTGSVNGIQTRGNVRAPRHYQLDAATGVVHFGDGQRGRRLPTGQPNISAQYRKGSGSQESELDMIQLQSLMSQRQMAVGLTTSLLNTLHGRFQLEESTDRPGDDYARQMENSPDSCRTRCEEEGNCQAFTCGKPNPGFAQGQCFLNRSEPKPVGNRCCISGTRSSAEQNNLRNIGR